MQRDCNMLTLPLHQLHIYYGQAGDNEVKISARQYLKELLSDYADMDVNVISIESGLNGKPFCKQFPEIQFSIAHSQNVFVLAFVRNSRVGIDLEDLTRSVDIKTLSEFLLAEKEYANFYSTNEKFHHEQLINAWTRKEAFVKAYGLGMSFPLKQLEVSFLLNEPASVKATHWRETERNEWCLHSFDLVKSYRGAVAVHGKINSVEIRNVASYCRSIQVNV